MARTYDPKQVAVIVGGSQISGFADGAFVTVERNDDAFTLQMGTDGEGTRSKTNNRSGRVTITLMQSSPSNALLQAFADADEVSNAGTFPLLIKDNSSLGTLFAAEQAWIVKKPSAGFDRAAGSREWILETDQLELLEAGH